METLRRHGACLVTCAEVPDLTPDDRHLRDALERRGVAVRVAAWDAPGARWSGWGAVVLRSTWDYHRRPRDFLAWLGACEEQGVRLFNPAPLVRWNHHKSYLADLAARGVPVVPTALVPRGRPGSLRSLLAERGWDRAVAKPAVAASAWRTFRTDPGESKADEERFAALRDAGDVLIQPFVPEIETDGELSFVFLGGALSHVVRKRPAPGDYRVQGEFGGAAERVDVAPPLLDAARRVVAAIPGPWLYARVDAVERGDALELMELELIEPELFLGKDPGAPDRMAEALEGLVAASPAQRSGTDIV